MQILMPLAGTSTFFPKEDYPFPKPLIDVAGIPMIERVIANAREISSNPEFFFVVLQDDVLKYSLDVTLRLIAGADAKIIALKEQTHGALCSCLMAIDQLDLDLPLVIVNGDQIIDADLGEIVRGFGKSDAAGGVITFDSVHPRWSYIRSDGADGVAQAAEKLVLSRDAIAGFYYFKTARLFVAAAMACIDAGQAHNNSFFVAPSLNHLILDGGSVRYHRIPKSTYWSFYSPSKIAEFESQYSPVKDGAMACNTVQLVIPAAGEGSRFAKAGYEKPKPFIDVDGSPMIEIVLNNVKPRNASVLLLFRTEHVEREEAIVGKLTANGANILTVSKLTEGTACTVLLARAKLDRNRPLLIANSDQIVDFDVDEFVDDCTYRQLDGSILVFRNTTMDPKWSFAKLNGDGLVTEVAEKRPISDLATVGIYYFRRAGDFIDGAVDMMACNDRVNNEFYTCPVYNYMIANGLRIGAFEVAESDMHGLGVPDDLQAYLAKIVKR